MVDLTLFITLTAQYNFTFGQSISDADFVAQDSFNISGQTRSQNGAGLSGVTVTLNNGSQPISVQTDTDGYYSFDAPAGGTYALTAAKAGLSFTPSTRDIAGLNANQKNVDFTVAQTAQQIDLLLEEPGTTMRAAALDAVLLMRDPFPVVNGVNLLAGSDHNTRVLVFVKNLQLAAGETASAHMVDALGQSFDVPAENLFALSGFDFSQLTFRLPDSLAPGNCTIEIRAPGQASNPAIIRIRM